MNKLMLSLTVMASILAGGCKSSSAVDTINVADQEKVIAPLQSRARIPSNAMPRAVIYKTNGDFDNNVPITMSSSGHTIISFPAPTDLSQAQTPIRLADGFLLDRRGVSQNTAFTRYTYESYMALPNAPTTEKLKEEIIPGAEITELVKLPFTPMEAAADTALCNRLIRENFPDCEIVVKRRAIQITPQQENEW